jgi:hypothetical protein
MDQRPRNDINDTRTTACSTIPSPSAEQEQQEREREPPTLLTIPTELRNEIYLYVFSSHPDGQSTHFTSPQEAPKFELNPTYHTSPPTSTSSTSIPERLALLQTCRQINTEAHLLALSLTPFHIHGPLASPDLFDLASRPLSPAKLGAIKHLILTARISHLRALNEAWSGLPFGHPSLKLDCLTIAPRRPDCSTTAYAEVADLSQSHTLAYVFAETFKGLRNVRCVEVRNQGCFNDVVWRIVYRSLVYRMWRWGGERCGVRFECSSESEDEREEREGERDAWFRCYLVQPEQRQDEQGLLGKEVGEEVIRLAGGEMPDPGTAAGAGH